MYKLRNIQWIMNHAMNDKWATVRFDNGVKMTVCRACAGFLRHARWYEDGESPVENYLVTECLNGYVKHNMTQADREAWAAMEDCCKGDVRTNRDPACFTAAADEVYDFFVKIGEDFSTVHCGNVLTVKHNETDEVLGTMFYAENSTITYVNPNGVAYTFTTVDALAAWLFPEGK